VPGIFFPGAKPYSRLPEGRICLFLFATDASTSTTGPVSFALQLNENRPAD
jgi:hypothetical protein